MLAGHRCATIGHADIAFLQQSTNNDGPLCGDRWQPPSRWHRQGDKPAAHR
jgi:hypothetical protein